MQWRNPPQNLFCSNSHLPKKMAGHCETHGKNCLGNTPKNLLRGESHLPQSNSPRRQTLHFAPRPVLWLKTPKLTLLGKKEQKKRWNLPQNFLAAQDGSAPEDQRLHETCATLVEPWWNLLAAKTDLPQRAIESPKAILPPNLNYGWRPLSYCCWRGEGKKEQRHANQTPRSCASSEESAELISISTSGLKLCQSGSLTDLRDSKLEKTMKMLAFFCHMSRDRSCRKKLPPSCCVSENPCKGWDHTSPSDSSTKAPSASRALAACHAHY